MCSPRSILCGCCFFSYFPHLCGQLWEREKISTGILSALSTQRPMTPATAIAAAPPRTASGCFSYYPQYLWCFLRERSYPIPPPSLPLSGHPVPAAACPSFTWEAEFYFRDDAEFGVKELKLKAGSAPSLLCLPNQNHQMVWNVSLSPCHGNYNINWFGLLWKLHEKTSSRVLCVVPGTWKVL